MTARNTPVALLTTPCQHRLDKLPQEILAIICKHLHTGASRSLISTIGASCDLKALRLVSQSFQGPAAQWLFKVLLLRPHFDYWRDFASIVSSPLLAKHVECLEVVNIEHLVCPIAGMISFAPCLENQAYHDALPSPKLGIGSSFAKSYKLTIEKSIEHREKTSQNDYGVPSCRNREFAYARYNYWRDGRNDIQKILRSARRSRIDLSKLARLREVRVVEHNDFVLLPTLYDLPAGSAVKKLASVVARDDIVNTKCWHLVYAENLELMIRTLQDSGHNLPSLAIHHSLEILNNVPKITKLSGLRKLTLEQPRYLTLCIERWIQRKFRLTQWLTDLPYLDTLEISQVWEAGSFNIVGLLRGQRYPQLRSLSLKGVFTTAEDIREFVGAHINALEALTIEMPVISSSRWQMLRDEIRSRYVNLDKMSIFSLILVRSKAAGCISQNIARDILRMQALT